MSVLIEPSMLIALFTVAIVCGSTDIATMGQHIVTGNVSRSPSSSPASPLRPPAIWSSASFRSIRPKPSRSSRRPARRALRPVLAMMKLAMGMKQVVVVAWFTSIFIPGRARDHRRHRSRGRRRLPCQVPVDFVVCGVLENSFPVRASRCSATRPGPSSASRSSRSSSSS
ncbi:MAG: hypothetical protein ACLU37_04475 [Collinsella sp.]